MHVLTKLFVVLVSLLSVLLVPLVVVYAHNENTFKSRWESAEMARMIVFSADQRVGVYFNRTTDPQDPQFEGPCEIYKGSDPEALILADFCPEGIGPELIIGDEDLGEFIPMRLREIPEACSVKNPFEEMPSLVQQALSAFDTPADLT